MDIMELTANILAAALRSGTPLLLAALGETLSERSGVLNLGLEGMMIMGAMGGFAAGLATGNPWLGALAAVIVGGLMALVHAFLSVSLRVNQVVSGLALTILGIGLSSFLGANLVGKLGPAFSGVYVPGLSDIPFLGQVLFRQTALVYIALLLIPITWFWLYRTRPGLHLRLVGENPSAADAVGINVTSIRYTYVIFGGMLAGLAGGFLSLAYTPGWTDFMTAGRGWIAVGLVIFGMWDPFRTALGALLFGAIGALQFSLQTMGVRVSVFFLQMLPYIFTLVVLGLSSHDAVQKRVARPEALGSPYERGERGV